jgi:hypothetical protein
MSTADETNAGAPADDRVDQSIELGMCKRDDGTTEVTIMGDVSTMRLLGTTNRDFYHGLVRQIANAGAKGDRPDELGVNCMLGFVIAGKPTNPIEASTLSLMAVCQRAFMEMANRLAHAENLNEADFADRSMNKLARTFAALTDTFQRYRANKEQKHSVHSLGIGSSAQGSIENLTQPRQQALLNEAVTAPLAGRRRNASEVTGKRHSGEAMPMRRRNRHGQP